MCRCASGCGSPSGCWRMVADGDLPEDPVATVPKRRMWPGSPPAVERAILMLFFLTS